MDDALANILATHREALEESAASAVAAPRNPEESVAALGRFLAAAFGA
jgi:hypothetical protein